MHKKKLIIISLSAGAAVAIAATFIALGLTVWKPKKKSTQEWLYDFKNSLSANVGTDELKTEKSIIITEDGAEVARYFRLLEIKNQNGETVAHLSLTEEYPTLDTNEFNVNDEYYFIGGTMYIQRIAGEEKNGTDFASSWDVFWEVVNENAGSASYDFSQSNFTDLKLTHENGLHSLSASVPIEKKYSFFITSEEVADMSEIYISMTIDTSYSLIEFEMNYIYMDKQSVVIRTVNSEPGEIEIKDFVRR